MHYTFQFLRKILVVIEFVSQVQLCLAVESFYQYCASAHEYNYEKVSVGYLAKIKTTMNINGDNFQ